MNRSLLVASGILLAGSGAFAQVVNFHAASQNFPNYTGYNVLYYGQGAYSDATNNVWNGFGQYPGPGNNVFYGPGNPDSGHGSVPNGVPIPGATNTSFTVTNLQGFNEGLYSVLATNSGGTNYFNAATVFLNNPLEFFDTTKLNGSFFSQLLCVVNTNYIIQVSTNLTTWTPVRTNSSPIGIITFTNPIITSGATQFFRAKCF